MSLSDTTDTDVDKDTDTETTTETDTSQQKTGDSGRWNTNQSFHNIENLHVCNILSFIIIIAADETSEKASAEDSTGKRDRVKWDRLYCIRWCWVNLNVSYNISDADHVDTDSKEKESAGKHTETESTQC